MTATNFYVAYRARLTVGRRVHFSKKRQFSTIAASVALAEGS